MNGSGRPPVLAQLGMLANVKTSMPDADFWIQRRGQESTVGRTISKDGYAFDRSYHGYVEGNIGVRVTATQLLDPRYLQYALENLYNQGFWRPRAHGTLSLKNIRVGDVKAIQFAIQPPTGGFGSGMFGPEDPWGGAVILGGIGAIMALLATRT